MSQFSYISHTDETRQKMLSYLGLSNIGELFSDIPESIRMTTPLNLPAAMSEITLDRHMAKLAEKNADLQHVTSFLGAGSYEHFQPSVIDAIAGRSEFYTSYTPYQAEISQGMLQAIFEYQTMVSELTGMAMANASMYDGPTAMAEAGLVCCAHTRRNKLIVAKNVNPEYREVVKTYASGQSIEIVELPYASDGRVDRHTLEEICDEDTAGVLVQYPNFFGGIEDLEAIANTAHAKGALLVAATYPIALGLLKTPGELGADLVIAEGQALGNLMAFGGPYLGIMAAKKELMRRLPGRIVGETTDADGKRGYVLTLQAREQHIRREKATSNICSNQALNALVATVFLAYMGPSGMHELAAQNYHKAHYLEQRLNSIKGVETVFKNGFFNEFTIRVPTDTKVLQDALLERGYFFGLRLDDYYPELERTLLINVTEMRTREEMDAVCEELEGLL
ncbi:aminomethyl-transferring glycine dehydrogenase subunit GcvPA [Alicyclobacillus sp. SO9]|uniref:aminomethyl-transferring glycine dehydrogenase subunit GcvPA n=1 Tax=Alicyclobacillus sp. SO9 TaxID=2665646 RepID=UPI0018E7F1D4|nr:aminomethyl-transferring glycine dehydrogenase subunit GcvPA [Alicyclobacillus sp. SO9]QQE76984.1 aminomethyl-transferring glycine dehydrogenase subunit GcvPA [Alicyclobacillus sp. SO9]